jgi:hypothetical protein
MATLHSAKRKQKVLNYYLFQLKTVHFVPAIVGSIILIYSFIAEPFLSVDHTVLAFLHLYISAKNEATPKPEQTLRDVLIRHFAHPFRSWVCQYNSQSIHKHGSVKVKPIRLFI